MAKLTCVTVSTWTRGSSSSSYRHMECSSHYFSTSSLLISSIRRSSSSPALGFLLECRSFMDSPQASCGNENIITGCALMSGFKMVYDLITLIAVGICNSPPENWPPVMDDPWRTDSLHRFQLLRRTFDTQLDNCSDSSMDCLQRTTLLRSLWHVRRLWSMAWMLDVCYGKEVFLCTGPVFHRSDGSIDRWDGLEEGYGEEGQRILGEAMGLFCNFHIVTGDG